MKTAFILTLALFAFSQRTYAADWIQVRGPNSDGSAPGEIKPWPSDNVRYLWRRQIRNGFSSFVIRDKTLATLALRERDGVRVEACLALDADTGRQKWVTLLTVAKYTNEHMPANKDGSAAWGADGNQGGDGPRSTPSIDGDRVYVMTSALTLYALDLATGEILWSHDLMREHAGQHIYYENSASPLIVKDLVIVAGGGAGQSILAFNKSTGQVAWKTLDEQLTHSTPTFTKIHNTPQAIFYTRSGLVSLQPATGDILWRYPFPYRVSAAISPVVAGDLVYCSSGYGIGSGVAKIENQNGAFFTEEIWRLRKNEPVANYWSTPIHKDGYLYGMFGFKKFATAPFKCVDIQTGEVKWEQPGFGHGNVIAVGQNLVALTGYGDLVLIEPTPHAYRELARAKVLTGKCWGMPIFSNNRIYLRSTTEAACLDFAPESSAIPFNAAAIKSP
jgi:outer membrane protein assembly factor BamB